MSKKLLLKNSKIIESLNQIKEAIMSDTNLIEKAINEKNNVILDVEGCTDEYLHNIFNKSDSELVINYRWPEGKNFLSLTNMLSNADPIIKKVSSLNHYFNGYHHIPLIALYPPGGFITWHHNADASGYNLLFSYSETGEGVFRYYDHDTKKIIDMYDEPNIWTVKLGNYSEKNEVDRLSWHCAKTDCFRLSIALRIKPNDVDHAVDLITRES